MRTIAAHNPKLRGPESLQAAWYHYYAGFSEDFAREALRSARVGPGEWVLDPWNGSGTTVSTAVSMGINARGYDLNPVMVIVAKARCLGQSEYLNLRQLALEVARQSKRSFLPDTADPLSAWLHPRSIAAVRAIEAAVQKLLVDDARYATLRTRRADEISDLAAFFYVALFRTVRQILRPFTTSNPTWIRRAKSSRFRLRPSIATVGDTFRGLLAKMIPERVGLRSSASRADREIGVASSDRLPVATGSVSCVLASPPYCTRIDYAVATSPELALLGYGFGDGFDTLRRQLIGTATVPEEVPEISDNLGWRCLDFLGDLSRHSSKASSTYYYKNHLQYFLSMAASLCEVRRVLRVGGRCILVVQDSYYKDLHNDLPAILSDMAALRGLSLASRTDFKLDRTLAGINPGAREYRDSFAAVESVLSFEARPISRAGRQH